MTSSTLQMFCEIRDIASQEITLDLSKKIHDVLAGQSFPNAFIAISTNIAMLLDATDPQDREFLAKTLFDAALHQQTLISSIIERKRH